MKRFVLAVSFALSTSFAAAQSVQQYLALRKQSGVTAPISGDSLRGLIGSKTVEIKGIVKGSFRVGERCALMIDSPSGAEIVDADAVPEWLLGNETPARLLVKATRPTETDPLRAVLIAAIPETDISRIEQAEAQKRAAEKAAAAKRKSTTTASRGGGLTGTIGRGGRNAKYVPSGTKTKEWILPASEVTPIYASFILKQNPRLSKSEALRIAQGIIGFSLHYKVDARLIMAMVICESGFDPNAVSRSGAMGLGQLMPGTAKWMGVNDPYDSVDNIAGAVKLIRTHLDQYRAQTGGKDFESLVLTLAAYNAGSGAVKRAGGVPPYRETQNYVRKVIAIYYQLAGYR
jgi:hypothetical protein